MPIRFNINREIRSYQSPIQRYSPFLCIDQSRLTHSIQINIDRAPASIPSRRLICIFLWELRTYAGPHYKCILWKSYGIFKDWEQDVVTVMCVLILKESNWTSHWHWYGMSEWRLIDAEKGRIPLYWWLMWSYFSVYLQSAWHGSTYRIVPCG